MEYGSHRVHPLIHLLLTIIGVFLLVYFGIGKDMGVIPQAAFMALAFVVCFFSVKISLIVLIFSMLLSPEFEVAETAKRGVTLRLEDTLLFAMTLGWMFRMAIFKDIGLVLRNPLNLSIATFSGILVLSTALGMYRGNVDIAAGSFFALKLIEYFVLFNVVVNHVEDEAAVGNLLTMLLVVCGIICLYGLLQTVIGGDIAAPFEGSRGERNTLGGYLVLLGSISAGVLLHTESAFEKRVLGFMLAILIIVLMFSISRSGWVSGIISMLILFFTAPKKSIFLIVICALIAALPFMTPDVVEKRVEETFLQRYKPNAQVSLFGIRLDESSSARIYSAIYVLHDFPNHPFLGYGITGYQFLDGQFFRFLIELGILGLASFVWLLAGINRLIRRSLHLTLPMRQRGMVVGFQAGFWGLIAHAFTANTFTIIRISEPFWCLAGLVVVTLALHEKRSENVVSEALTVAAG